MCWGGSLSGGKHAIYNRRQSLTAIICFVCVAKKKTNFFAFEIDHVQQGGEEGHSNSVAGQGSRMPPCISPGKIERGPQYHQLIPYVGSLDQ